MAAGHSADHNYLNHEKGLWSWLTTLDHKRIGVMYMITVMAFFFVGGIAALAIRTETPEMKRLVVSTQTFPTLFAPAIVITARSALRLLSLSDRTSYITSVSLSFGITCNFAFLQSCTILRNPSIFIPVDNHISKQSLVVS